MARDFCFKYGEKQDGRKDIDSFRRPLHCRDSLLRHLSILFGKDGAELETWIGAFTSERKGRTIENCMISNCKLLFEMTFGFENDRLLES